MIEMAIVLIILTLVVGSALVPLAAQIEQRQRAETQRTLDEIKEALIGYALANGVLPCPSAVSAGNPTGIASTPGSATCPPSGIAADYLPWVTLGVNNKDAWGNLIRYAVDTQFTTTAFGLGTTGSITIKTHNADGTTPTISSTIPAVVLSMGKNGYGAMSADYILQSSVPANNTDEKQNSSTNSPTYFSHTPAPQGTDPSKGGEFDDMVVWISPNILFNRMVAAGVLPR